MEHRFAICICIKGNEIQALIQNDSADDSVFPT